jgi:hypothetical protein
VTLRARDEQHRKIDIVLSTGTQIDNSMISVTDTGLRL